MRQALATLRRYHNTKLKTLLTWAGVVLGVSGAAAVLVDLLLPLGGWWNLLRSALLIPLAGSMFALLYSFSLFLHHQRREVDPEWVPYRFRYSVMMRRRMAAVAGALVVVLMYAVRLTAVYTLLSALLVTAVIALFAFVRTTSEEEFLEKQEIPDSRDLSFDNFLREEARERLAASKRRKRGRRSRRSEELEEDFEEEEDSDDGD